MQNKNIYFLIAILIILLAAGTAIYYLVRSGKTVTPDQQSRQEQLGRIIELKDLTACEDLAIKEDAAICRNTVAMTLAKEKLDASFCGKLDKKEDQDNCQKMVLYDKAEQEGVAVCQQAGTDEAKIDCEKEYYLTMAIEKNDIAQCANLENEEWVKKCQEDFSQSQWQRAR